MPALRQTPHLAVDALAWLKNDVSKVCKGMARTLENEDQEISMQGLGSV